MKFVACYCPKSFTDAIESDHQIKNFDNFIDASEFVLKTNHQDWTSIIQIVDDSKIILTLKYNLGLWVVNCL